MEHVAEKARQRKSVMLSIDGGDSSSSPRSRTVSPREEPLRSPRDRAATSPLPNASLPPSASPLSPAFFKKPKLNRAKSERLLVIQHEDSAHHNGGGPLKGSRSLDSLFLTDKYDVIVNGRDRKDKVKRISSSVGKKLLNEVMCDYAY